MNHEEYLKQFQRQQKVAKRPEIEFDQELSVSFDDLSELDIDTDPDPEDQLAV